MENLQKFLEESVDKAQLKILEIFLKDYLENCLKILKKIFTHF